MHPQNSTLIFSCILLSSMLLALFIPTFSVGCGAYIAARSCACAPTSKFSAVLSVACSESIYTTETSQCVGQCLIVFLMSQMLNISHPTPGRAFFSCVLQILLAAMRASS